MFKNTAQKISVFAFDYSTGAPKTGLSTAANLVLYTAIDDAAPVAIGDITIIELDVTNAPGWYKFDLTAGETNGDMILITGKSDVANVSIVGQLIYTMPPAFPSLTIANNAVNTNATHWLGTALASPDTAGFPKVTHKTGSGLGELFISSGVVQANLKQIDGIAQSMLDLKDFADDGYDPTTNQVVGVINTNNVTQTLTVIVGSIDAGARAEVKTEVVDALATDTYVEPGQGLPPATASLAAKIGYLFKWARNRTQQTATESKWFADNGTTVDHKAPTSDDGTTYDQGKIISGP